jgi:NADPH2:quinone reductase
MKAAWYERNGAAADVLIVGELPDPHPGPGEVRVRLKTSAVNPSDVKSRSGSARQLQFERQVPHSDGAGVIDEVGAGIDPARLGERVWTWNAAFERPGGTAAQWTVVPSAQAVALPAEADFSAGACLGIPVITAHRAVFADGPPTGQTVLVSGGAGAVGNFAVQLAKWAGARVFTTVDTAAKAERAREAGADAVFDYQREDVAERVLALTGGAGVDRVVEVEFAHNLGLNLRVAKMGAVIATYATVVREPQIPFFDLLKRNLVLRMVHMYGLPQPVKDAAMADIAAWIGSGRARFNVAARFPLERIVQAHEAVEAGAKVGQVLIDID